PQRRSGVVGYRRYTCDWLFYFCLPLLPGESTMKEIVNHKKHKSHKRIVMLFAFYAFCAFCGYSLFGQAANSQTVVADIPGVVKAGTTIQLVKDNLDGTDDPIGLPDGTLLFTEPNANRIFKIDKTGRIATFREHTNGGL